MKLSVLLLTRERVKTNTGLGTSLFRTFEINYLHYEGKEVFYMHSVSCKDHYSIFLSLSDAH